jgi:hypothetical protein
MIPPGSASGHTACAAQKIAGPAPNLVGLKPWSWAPVDNVLYLWLEEASELRHPPRLNTRQNGVFLSAEEAASVIVYAEE